MPSSVLAFLRQASALALALGLALPAWSQSTSGGAPSASSPATRTTGEYQEMLEDLAHAHLAAIETGRLALEKTRNTQVRSYAQQMIDDHGKALQELQQLGQEKRLSLPRETDFQHKAIAAALRLLSGETFDKQYIRQAGIRDHRRTVDLLMKLQQTSQDAPSKAYAAKQLPIVERHLGLAREMDQKMK